MELPEGMAVLSIDVVVPKPETFEEAQRVKNFVTQAVSNALASGTGPEATNFGG